MAVVCGDWKRLCRGKRGVAEEGLEGYYHDFAQYSHRWDSVLAGDWRVASPSGLRLEESRARGAWKNSSARLSYPHVS